MHSRAVHSLSASARLFAAQALLFLAACGGGGDGGTPPGPVTVSTVGVSLAASSIAVGATTTATATPRDSRGSAIAGKTPTWTSSNTAVATVNASGTVTGVSAGNADISATVDGVRGQASITITPAPVASVTVTLGAGTIGVGQTTQAAAVLRDGNGGVLTGRTTTWASSNTAVATVSGTGLVTGVAAGTAQISATSEGRTGQATVTVTATVTFTNIQLLDASGQPLDTSKVAGRIRISFDADVPPGWRGVRQVRVGSRIMAQDSVFGTSSALARVVGGSITVDLAQATPVINVNELEMQVLRNGPSVLDIIQTVAPPGGQSQSVNVSRNVTLNQNNGLFLFTRAERNYVLDGVAVRAGNLDAYIGLASYTGEALSKVEILRGPAQTIYGSQAVAGVVSIITRNAPDIHKPFTIPASLLNVETGPQGARPLFKFTFAGKTEIVPWSQLYDQGGAIASIDGTGLAYDAPTPALGLTIPQGFRYQHIPIGNLPQAMQNYERWFGASVIDNVPPRDNGKGMAPQERQLVIGNRATWPGGSYGIARNYIGLNTPLSDFFHPVEFVDASGLDLTAGVNWYASKDLATLSSSANRITSFGSIPASQNREWYIGGTLRDRAGNSGFYTVKTNQGNPYTTGGGISTGSQLGQTNAIFGRYTSGGTTFLSYPAGQYVFGQSVGLSNFSFTGTTTGSQYGLNLGSALGWRYGNKTDCLWGYDGCNTPEVYGSSSSNNGFTGTFSFTPQNLVDRWKAKLGGTGEGVIEATFLQTDFAGNEATGGLSWGNPYIGLVDLTNPTAQVNVTSPSAGNVNVAITGNDNLGVERFTVGAEWDWDNPFNPSIKLRVPFYSAPMGNNLTQGLSTSATVNIPGVYPRVGTFFDPITGNPTGTSFNIRGVYAEVKDWAHNWSPVVSLTYPNTEPLPTAPTGLNIKHSIGGLTVCGGQSCSGGVPTSVNFRVVATTPTRGIPFPKGKVVVLNTSTGRTWLAGEDDTPDEAQVAGGWSYTYDMAINASALRLSSGSYATKATLGYSDGKRVYFSGTFGSLNVAVPSNSFNMRNVLPDRPLIPPPPPPPPLVDGPRVRRTP